MHPTRRYRRRLWAGRTLLVLAVGMYGVALVVPMYSPVPGDIIRPGWTVYKATTKQVSAFAKRGEWAAFFATAGVMYPNATCGIVAFALPLGWVGFARVLGAVSSVLFWWSLTVLFLIHPLTSLQFIAWLGGCRGAWLWVASIHLVALAAFVTPRRPRQPDAD